MAKRAGRTQKVSLSVDRDDLRLLRQRAKRLHGGNVSAVFGELIAEIKRREAWERAVAWFGEPIELTASEQRAIDRELLGKESPRVARRRRMASAAQRGDAVYTGDVSDLERLRAYFPSVRVFGVT